MKTLESGQQQTIAAAMRHFEAGQYDQTVDLCRRMLEKNPKDVSALNLLGILASKQGHTDDAVDYFREATQAAPDNPNVMANLAQMFLERGDHLEALETFRHAYELAGRLRGNMVVCRNSMLDPAKAAAKEAYVHRIRDVIVDTSYWTVIKGDRLYSEEIGNLDISNHPFVNGLSRNGKFVVIDLPVPVMEVKEPCVFLGGDDNYAHWHIRYLMRLALLDDQPDIKGLRLLVNENLKPYQRTSLALLGYGEERLIHVPRHTTIRCRDLHIPTCLLRDFPRVSLGVHWLRKHILDAVGPSPAPTPRRIFISRKDAPSRYLVNEDEILAAVQPFEVQPVELSRLSFAEQVRLFAGADLVVAPHGAGLVNLIYAPDSCRIVELVSDPIAHMLEFRVIAMAIGQKGQVVPCTTFQIPPGATKPNAEHNFRTDPAAVVSAVKALIG